MTNEEAIEFGNMWLEINEDCKDSSTYTFFQIAIEALEQQPCEDCISRKEVIDIINFEDEWLFDAKSHNTDTEIAFSAIKTKISKMPPVTPKFTDVEIQKMQELEQAQLDKAYELGKTEIRPCEDCISREAVDEYITNLLSGYLYDEERTRLEDLSAFVWELSSVQSTRPTGKWNKIHPQGIYECSKCGINLMTEDIECYEYCHGCGAKMEV